MPVDPKFIVNLKGKDYPTWPGILDAAWREGLLKIEVTPIQNPSEENGWTAIAQARAEFKDGRVFQEIGDCNPKNTAAMIATAAPRMAATRAKGRALRDALNIGTTMYEELPETPLEEAPQTPYATQAIRDPNAKNGKPPARPPRFGHLDRAAAINAFGEWKGRAKACGLSKERAKELGLPFQITQSMGAPEITTGLERLAPWVEAEEARLGKRPPVSGSASVPTTGDTDYRTRQDALHLEHAQQRFAEECARARRLDATDLIPDLADTSLEGLRKATQALTVLLDRMEEAPLGVEREVPLAA